MFWFVTIAIIYTLFLPAGLNDEKSPIFDINSNNTVRVLAFIAFFLGVFFIILGIEMSIDWVSPLKKMDTNTLVSTAAQAGAKGGLVLVLFAVWPYFLIIWGILNTYLYKDAFKNIREVFKK